MNATAASVSRNSEERGNDPSMEEILASIRRIIADDRILPPAARPKKAEPERAPPAVLPDIRRSSEPSRQIGSEPESLSPPPRLGGQRRGDFAPEARATLSERLAPAPTLDPTKIEDNAPDAQSSEDEAFLSELSSDALPAPNQETEAEPLAKADLSFAAGEPILSPATGASVASSFQSLATTMLLQNSEFVEQTVRDMLRPLLKQWLDEHLPTIVERLVRAEIERVARGPKK